MNVKLWDQVTNVEFYRQIQSTLMRVDMAIK